MIKNERQYRITKSQVGGFARALDDLARQRASNPPTRSLAYQLQEDAMRSQLTELQQQLREYENLREQQAVTLQVSSFAELPNALIKARICLGLTQQDLANRLGLKEQQIQRYEATEYAGASLSRIQQIVEALGLHISEQITLPPRSVSIDHILKRLRDAGLPDWFVQARLLPRAVSNRVLNEASGAALPPSLAIQIASAVGRVFNWSAADVLGSAPLLFERSSMASVRFKLPKSSEGTWVTAYSFYAHVVALLTIQATPNLKPASITLDSVAIRDAMAFQEGQLAVEKAIRLAWSYGIPVLPLFDPGSFHGACFRVDGRNVIVLKQNTTSAARWLIDLLHELFHCGEEPDSPHFGVVETNDILAHDASRSEQEQAATDFAVDVALGGRQEALITECVKQAGGDIKLFKRSCEAVAQREGVDVGVLANYLAYRLQQSHNVNWWATATTLQQGGVEVRDIAKRLFLEYVDLSLLSDLDRELLINALQEVG